MIILVTILIFTTTQKEEGEREGRSSTNQKEEVNAPLYFTLLELIYFSSIKCNLILLTLVIIGN